MVSSARAENVSLAKAGAPGARASNSGSGGAEFLRDLFGEGDGKPQANGGCDGEFATALDARSVGHRAHKNWLHIDAQK
jgi:hypothetical protein